MEWIETTGRTVAEALDAALDELGVDEQDVEVVIVAEAKSGLFGFGRSDAHIRARVRPSRPRPKRSQRDRVRGSRGGQAGPEGSRRELDRGRAGTSRASRAGRSARAKSANQPGAEEGPRPDIVESVSAQAAAKRGRRRRGGRGRASARGEPAARLEAGGEEEAMTVEEQVDLVGTFVRGVVERFGYEATTTTRVEDDRLYVDVTGEDLGLLIGPRGSTLDALQELARTVVQRRGDERALRVVVDVAGFRARRAVALEAFTRRRAAEVLETGIAEALEPMSAADRKIVHDTVSSIEGLETGSEGIEPKRYVVIRPAAESESRRGPDEN